MNVNHTPTEVQPRDLREIEDKTGNIYESIVVLGKRARQIAMQQKDELHDKLAEFAPNTDTLEEVFENREQIEISTYYERLPKPTITATEEFIQDKVYFRNPDENLES
ncbi:MAG: DNA-directed RNA polymerase subunit omega [Bacteroidota bacterium]|nr:DNA-directed RNA polymerase subunit omega [Bacteroidota bacterium]